MRAQEIRAMRTAEIRERLEEAHRELFNLRQEWFQGRLEDHNRLRAVQREIARFKTILREQELAAEMTVGGAE